MAIDYTTETRPVFKQIEALQAANGVTSSRQSEQNQIALGTNRRSEILGKIGDTGQTYQKIYNDYIDSL